MEYLQKLNSINNSHYSISDIKFLKELISTRIPIKTALDIISVNKTKAIKETVFKKLDNGLLFEDVIYDYLPKEIKKYFIKLIKILGFEKTIDISLNIIENRKKNIDSIISKSLYPIILLLVSIVALIIFDNFALDSIIQMMSSFVSDLNSINIFRLIFGIFTKILMIIIFLCIVLLIICLFFNKGYYVYCLLNKYLSNNIFCTFYTNEFINLYVIFVENGYKTKEALDIISKLDNLTVAHNLAISISERLVEGDDFIRSMDSINIDDSLTKFIKIACMSSDFIKILISFIEYSNSKITAFIKKITTIVQLSSYVVIGLIIIFVYQLLFMPMQAITGF